MHALVTGGNGHLGFNLVQALLAQGHRVRASVRSLADTTKSAPLRALGTVELVEAELHQADRLRVAMQGIDTLFHAAAVYATADPAREQEIMEASLLGTRHALQAAADARVQKVVLTSSAVTIALTAPGALPSTEVDWNPELGVPYFRAKVEGERLAWQLAGELGLNLVTLLPGGIIGPGFQRNTPTIDLIEAAMRGYFRLGVPNANFSFVDVRDVARAHLLAAKCDAQGRYIVCNDVQPSFHALLRTMHRVDSRVKLPLLQMPRFAAPIYPWFDRFNHLMLGTARLVTPEMTRTVLGHKVWNLSSAHAKAEIAWQPEISFEDSLRDTMAAIRARWV